MTPLYLFLWVHPFWDGTFVHAFYLQTLCRSRSGHVTKSISQRYRYTRVYIYSFNSESNRRGRIKPPRVRIKKKERKQQTKKRERERKRTKIGALRRVSNFVHGRACFAGIRGIKEKYDDTGSARSYTIVRSNGRRNGSVETINDSGGENVRWRGEITRGRREIP